MLGNRFRVLVMAAMVVAVGPLVRDVAAQSSTAAKPVSASSASNARAVPVAPASWMTNLTADPRARNLNDLLTIRIEESVTASGSADSKVGKTSSAKADFPSPISTGLGKFLPNGSDTAFTGSGSTSRSSAITALLTARVTEVLPNGDLVIEGVREVDVNGDNQIVVLTGVVRPLDVAQGNTVSSTLIGQLRIRSIGRGLIKDSLSPGWLMRILNKIF